MKVKELTAFDEDQSDLWGMETTEEERKLLRIKEAKWDISGALSKIFTALVNILFYGSLTICWAIFGLVVLTGVGIL